MPTQPPTDLRNGWRTSIRSAGMRVTQQREALLAAVWRLRHATAESLVTELARADASVNLSTVYRGLGDLERIGLVRHAHLGAGTPTYHITAESHHIHLQCNSCGAVISVDIDHAQPFVQRLATLTGFEADITHAAIYGTCADCLVAQQRVAGEDGA